LQWDKLLRQHEPLQGNILRESREPATLIYTSGSTGVPKGVMHKVGNFSFASDHAVKFLKLGPDERFFSYLPMAHIGERFFVEMGCLYSGGEISFAESVDKFQENIRYAKPTIFLGVHRIWKKFQEGILGHLPEKKLNLLMKIPIISGIVKKKIRVGLGFEKTTKLFTSAAPTPASLLTWYRKIGIDIAEGYAMTENFGYSTASKMTDAKLGSVGYALPEVALRIADDGEIQVKHEALMDGYYKDPELTRDAFTSDGFLRTGDRGEIDADGYLKITGRTKDLFKTSKGKYVAPSPIEMKIGSHEDIEMACITGSALPQPIVLITLTEVGRSREKNKMAAEISEHIRRINITLDAHEKIEKIVLINDHWTVDNDMLTPTMKLKRREVDDKYSAYYENWYGLKDFVVNG
jgi:long-subunit acyl-CoA synthetase (AMP-forming)